MSAIEVIEKIKSLPPKEKAEVADFIHQMENNGAKTNEGVRYMDKATFKEAKDRVFEKHKELFEKLAK